nr:MAG TPA: Helix-turn-helix XRE-family like protein [Caudoviricetes sp.]
MQIINTQYANDRNSEAAAAMKIYDYNGKKNICGERLREARVVRRLRQEDLAARVQIKGVNIERDSISRIEIGTRFVSDFELKIFAEVLGVSVNWLLGIEE